MACGVPAFSLSGAVVTASCSSDKRSGPGTREIDREAVLAESHQKINFRELGMTARVTSFRLGSRAPSGPETHVLISILNKDTPERPFMSRIYQRVVTGQTPDGASVFSHRDEVEAIHLVADKNLEVGHMQVHPMWRMDGVPTLPFYNNEPVVFGSDRLKRTHGQAVVTVVAFPAGFGVRPREFGDGGAPQVTDNRNTSEGGCPDPLTQMHLTNSVEVYFVISGSICVELDDNAEVKLSAGDTLVQHGAMHAWRNRSDDECVLGCIAFAADRVSP